MIEKKLQREIIVYLKSQGCYVIKTVPGMGTPTGTPDIIALYRGTFIAIEVKSSSTAPYQPGQEAALNYLRRGMRLEHRYVYRAYPENWQQIKAELDMFLFDY